MATEVKLPGLGEGVESGDVLELYVKEGDTVSADQNLLELETDKATVSVPSPMAGKIVKLMVSEGETVAVGSVIAHMDAADDAAEEAPEQSSPKPAEKSSAKSSEKSAEKPSKPAPAAEEPVPAAEQPTPAPQPSTTQAAAPQAAPRPAPAAQPAPAPTSATAPATASVAAGPAVRRFAREVGVDLSTVSGTGDGGRITRDDVLRAVRESSSLRTSSTAGTQAAADRPPTAMPQKTGMTPAPPAVASPVGGNKAIALPGEPKQDDYGPVRVERLSKMRKTIAAQMHKSWSTVPRVTNFDDADVTDLESFRASSKDDYASQGIKLTTMPFLIKAVATALRQHPTMNAIIDMENDQITYRDYVNLGIAVDTERGLVVPNIRHADSLSIPGIAKALAELATRVRGGEFGVNELRGGTFTISNLGAIGGTYSTPIVNVPEVAILLVGRTRKLPVVMDDDSIQPRLMMPLSLSYDHRLVDGGTAARFLNDVIAYLEAPSRLLLAIT